MNVEMYPQAAAVAARFQQRYGVDPLDDAKVEAAVRQYVLQRGLAMQRGGTGGVFGLFGAISLVLAFVMAAVAKHSPVLLAVVVPLFALSLVLTVRGFRGLRAKIDARQWETLPYIVGRIECLRATTGDPDEQERVEMEWRIHNGLSASKGTRYRLPTNPPPQR